MRRNTILQLASAGDGSRVVDARSTVKGRHVAAAGLVEAVGEPVARGSTSCALANHLVNRRRWARVLDVAVVVARGFAVVVLHQARVAHAAVCCRGADTAVRLLHDDGEDEAVVDA